MSRFSHEKAQKAQKKTRLPEVGDGLAVEMGQVAGGFRVFQGVHNIALVRPTLVVQIASGVVTLPIFAPAKGGCIWPYCWIWVGA